tara:strand:- start:1994 stop:2341 length:348 start_codon:yes stop_codon:yes gene_type:complete
MAETIGYTTCLTPTCESEVEIKQASKHGGSTLYLHCPNCSIQYLRGKAGQDYLLKCIGAVTEPEPAPQPDPIPNPQSPITETTTITSKPEPDPEPEAEPQPEPEPVKKESWFGEI